MALYNEFRPLTLEQVRGQNIIKSQLKALFESGQIPNALLFVGPRGTGKTTIARIVARFVNCEHPEGDPCNQCKSCKEILAGQSMDVKELDAASNNKVEDVRQIIEDAQYAPIGNKKVYILDEVHMFSTGAWNALLKILEEPPKDVLFILCTTEEHKIPATIVSRCRRLFFERVDLSEIAGFMSEICESKGVAYDKDALLLIARASEGCVRDALSILESFLDVEAVITDTVARTLGLSGEDVVFDILNGIQSGDARVAIGCLKQATGRGVSVAALVKALIGAVSDALFIKQGADISKVVNTDRYKELLNDFAKTAEPDRYLELISELTDIYGNISKTADAQFLVEAALLKTVQYESELNKLKARVADLERLVANGVVSVPVKEVEKVEVKEEPRTTKEPDADGFAAVGDDDIPPFEEDEEPEYFDVAQAFGDAAPKTEVPAPVNDVYASLPVEVGESVSLFSTDASAAPKKSEDVKSEEKSGDKPAEPFVKVKDEMPCFNGSALAGCLWQ